MAQRRPPGAATARLEALEQGWGQAVSPRVPTEAKSSPLHVSGWAHVSRAEAARSVERLDLHEELRALSREFEGLLRRHGKALTDEHDTRKLRYRIAVLEAEKDHRREKYSRLKAQMKKLQREDASTSWRAGEASMTQQLAAQDRIIQALREENLRQQEQLQQLEQIGTRCGLHTRGVQTTRASATATPASRTSRELIALDQTLEQTDHFFQDAIAQELERIAAVPIHGDSRVQAAVGTRERCDIGQPCGVKTRKFDGEELGEPPVALDERGRGMPVAKRPQQQVLTEWLRGVGLGEYALAFSLEGFDDLSLLLELEPARVDDLTLATAMRFGHAAKFKVRLAELHAIRQQLAEDPTAHVESCGATAETEAGLSQTLVYRSTEAAVARADSVSSAVRAQLTSEKQRPIAKEMSQPLPESPAVGVRLEPELEPAPDPAPEPDTVLKLLEPQPHLETLVHRGLEGGSREHAAHHQLREAAAAREGRTQQLHERDSPERQFHVLLSSAMVIERSAGASRARRNRSTRRPAKAVRSMPMRPELHLDREPVTARESQSERE